jgi:D-psicose/D-tagatose/L-ribulose 3-epimerase
VALAVAEAKAAGYDILELSLPGAKNLDTAAAKSVLEDAGLDIVCSRGLAFDADISSDDPSVVARGAKLLQHSLQVTSELGGRLLTGALYSALGKYGHALTSVRRKSVVSALRELAQEAQGKGMKLGLEICNRYETNVINTASQALTLANNIGEDNVLIHLDSYHMNIEEDDFVRLALLVGDRLGYVHIGENHRGYLGSGHLDFTAFFHALTNINYTGSITFEPFSLATVSPRWRTTPRSGATSGTMGLRWPNTRVGT